MKIDDIRNEFLLIEAEHFKILNDYILGVVKIKQIDEFKKKIMDFRDVLDHYEYKEEELIEVARMKSSVQHYITDSLEDDNVLKQAYANDPSYTEKL